MKRITAALLCLCLALCLTASSLGAGGSREDPVVTQSYLTKVWLPELLSSLDLKQTDVYNRSLSQLAEQAAENHLTSARSGALQSAMGLVTLKQGDRLYPAAGCKLQLYYGTVTAAPGLIDVTRGVPAEGALKKETLFMQSDVASAGLPVTSPTAEMWICGNYTLDYAAGVDYGSLAAGLQAMGLFSGVTQGYNLDGGTTRAQGLVMFLRLMGLEDEALQCKASLPFTDIPKNHWAYPYVAYAYEKGLTKGQTATAFGPDSSITARHYVTFLMRALHYEEGSQFSYASAEKDCVTLGLFRKGEMDALGGGAMPRRGLVYLSWYGLFAADGKSGETLLESLIASGDLTAAEAGAGMNAVLGGRPR